MNRHIVAFAILLATASVCQAQARKWTDVTGKFSVEAQFVELKDGQVRLRKTDGQEITVALEKLSAMYGCCTAVACRRKALLAYFG